MNEEQLIKYLREDKEKDVEFDLGNQKKNKRKLSCHQVVLSLSSSYWKEEFFPTNYPREFTKENCKAPFQKIYFQNPKISYVSFQKAINFCYHQAITFDNVNEIVNLILTASHFKFGKLLDHCLKLLLNELNEENCVWILDRFLTDYWSQGAIVNKLLQRIIKLVHLIFPRDRVLCDIAQCTAEALLSLPRTCVEEYVVCLRIIERGISLSVQTLKQPTVITLKASVGALLKYLNPDLLPEEDHIKIIERVNGAFLPYTKLIQRFLKSQLFISNLNYNLNGTANYAFNAPNFQNKNKKSLKKTNTTISSLSKSKSHEIVLEIPAVDFQQNDRGVYGRKERRTDYDFFNNAPRYTQTDLTKQIFKVNNEGIRVIILTTDDDEQRQQDIISTIKCNEFAKVDLVRVGGGLGSDSDEENGLEGKGKRKNGNGGGSDSDSSEEFVPEITLEMIDQYDTAFVYSTAPFAHCMSFGKLLKKWVKSGRGLILCSVFSLISQRGFNAGELFGRIAETNFCPFQKGNLIQSKPATLGKIHQKDHAILKNVKTFSGGKYSYRVYDPKNEEHVKSLKKYYQNQNETLSKTQNEKSRSTTKKIILDVEQNKFKGFEKKIQIFDIDDVLNFTHDLRSLTAATRSRSGLIFGKPNRRLSMLRRKRTRKSLSSLRSELNTHNLLEESSEFEGSDFAYTNLTGTKSNSKKKKRSDKKDSGKNRKKKKRGKEKEKKRRRRKKRRKRRRKKRDRKENKDKDEKKKKEKRKGGRGEKRERKERRKQKRREEIREREKKREKRKEREKRNEKEKGERSDTEKEKEKEKEKKNEKEKKEMKTKNNENENGNGNEKGNGNENENENGKEKEKDLNSGSETEIDDYDYNEEDIEMESEKENSEKNLGKQNIINKSSQVIAEWSDGIPLIIEKKFENPNYGKFIVFNFFPISDKISKGNGYRWENKTDGTIMIHNTIKYASTNSPNLKNL
ncbi:chascon [Anaeramoeba flamelloides]|uniref:Chascon n=1 Tax=Anaeramoeba flamelloides TaxID=1746091 RepID=A0ABQ8ZD79_9EUKA|nr:chascon [Anaeramoeba flamelloides]